MTPIASCDVFCVPGRNETCSEAFGLVQWPTPEARFAGLDWARDLAPLDMAGQVELLARNVMAHWHPRAIVAGWPRPLWRQGNPLAHGVATRGLESFTAITTPMPVD